MLKEYKTMFNGDVMERIIAMRTAESAAYQAGYEKGKQEGYDKGFSEGKCLHDGNCHALSQPKNDK